VPLVENNALKYASPILDDYLAPLLEANIDTLVLGCTHYPLLKDLIRSKVSSVNVVSQDEIMSKKLRDYLDRHPEVDERLSKNSSRAFLTTDIAPSTNEVAKLLFGEPITLEKVSF
jgi:glutamate racemase